MCQSENRGIDKLTYSGLECLILCFGTTKKWEPKLNFDSHFNIVETVLNFFSDHLHGFTADLFQ